MSTESAIITSKKSHHKHFDIDQIRQDFPALQQYVHNKNLVYLDNAATSQKPQVLLDLMRGVYLTACGNVHRAVHTLSTRATQQYEEARNIIANFINAEHNHEVIFVRGTTEGINLVAQSYGHTHVNAGDEIVISAMEHHSNIVPWQILCKNRQAHLRVIPMNKQGELDIEAYAKLLGPRTRLVAITHVSNVLGTINPVKRMTAMAHALNIPVLLDGAQAVPHFKIDVQDLNCDFYVFSGHKLFAPTGTGVLYGKTSFLEAMPPYQSGGDMIANVSFEKTTYNVLPYKFEAGTPDIMGTIGLATAIRYLEELGWEGIEEHEQQLLSYGTRALQQIEGLRLLGTAQHKVATFNFVIDDIHPHDIGTVLDHQGIAIRSGHHCAQPVMSFYGVPATSRASLAFYNTIEEIDALVEGLEITKRIFHKHG